MNPDRPPHAAFEPCRGVFILLGLSIRCDYQFGLSGEANTNAICYATNTTHSNGTSIAVEKQIFTFSDLLPSTSIAATIITTIINEQTTDSSRTFGDTRGVERLCDNNHRHRQPTNLNATASNRTFGDTRGVGRRFDHTTTLTISQQTSLLRRQTVLWGRLRILEAHHKSREIGFESTSTTTTKTTDYKIDSSAMLLRWASGVST